MPHRIVSIRQYDMKSVNLYDSTAMSVQRQASPPAGFILAMCPFLSMFSNPWGIVYACKETMISAQMQPFQSEWQLVEACGSPWQSLMAYARRFIPLPLHPSGRAASTCARAGSGIPSPIRPKADSCVLKDTARYVSGYPKPSGLLPEALPHKGDGFLSEVGKPRANLRYAHGKRSLCRDTKSI